MAGTWRWRRGWVTCGLASASMLAVACGAGTEPGAPAGSGSVARPGTSASARPSGSSAVDPAAPVGTVGEPVGTVGAPVTTSTSGSETAAGPGAAATAPARPSRGCGAGGRAAPVTGAHTDETLTSSGVARDYKRWVPTAATPATPLPLVFDLHGYTEGAAVHSAMSGLGPFGETHGFVTVTPHGTGTVPFWNAVPVDGGPDDIGLVSDLIDATGDALCIDLRRVYATGLSNGAFLSSSLGCRLSGKVTAIAPVAGLMMLPGCRPDRAVPVVAFHGTADQLVAYDTDGTTPAAQQLLMPPDAAHALRDLPFRNIPATLAAWAELAGCDSAPTTGSVTASVTLVRHQHCRDGAEVALYAVRDGGHTWPGSPMSQAIGDLLGPTTMEISANELMWAFFQRFALPA